MAEMKGEPVPETREVTLQLGVPLLLPATWIPEESLRMALYKKIAASQSFDALVALKREAADRYGLPPQELDRLLDIARLKILARTLGVKALQRRGDEMSATFEKDHRLDMEKVLAALRRGELSAQGPDAFRAFKVFEGTKDLAAIVPLAARFLVALSHREAFAGLSGDLPFELSASPRPA